MKSDKSGFLWNYNNTYTLFCNYIILKIYRLNAMKMFKAYLQNSDFSIKEIRKFNLYPSNLSDRFEVLCNKIKELFPELNHKNFIVSWKGNCYFKDNFLFFFKIQK